MNVARIIAFILTSILISIIIWYYAYLFKRFYNVGLIMSITGSMVVVIIMLMLAASFVVWLIWIFNNLDL